MKDARKKLYRRVNTKSHMPNDHYLKLESSYDRNTKKGISRSIKKKNNGVDCTPLYNFLLSSVGENWDKVHKEAISKLDGHTEEIFYMVKLHPEVKQLVRVLSYMRCGNAFYSTLIVDENGLL